jgi:hypothetical protein
MFGICYMESFLYRIYSLCPDTVKCRVGIQICVYSSPARGWERVKPLRTEVIMCWGVTHLRGSNRWVWSTGGKLRYPEKLALVPVCPPQILQDWIQASMVESWHLTNSAKTWTGFCMLFGNMIFLESFIM